ncbi:hypothetical protein RYX36_035768 [Vicia faba]
MVSLIILWVRKKEDLKFSKIICSSSKLNSLEGQTYKLGLTKFADLTNEEYHSMFLGTKPRKSKGFLSRSKKSNRYAFGDNEELSESIDCREKSVVNQVKDQGQCGKFFELN